MGITVRALDGVIRLRPSFFTICATFEQRTLDLKQVNAPAAQTLPPMRSVIGSPFRPARSRLQVFLCHPSAPPQGLGESGRPYPDTSFPVVNIGSACARPPPPPAAAPARGCSSAAGRPA